LNLVKYFQSERPFYALCARGFEPGHPFCTSMDGMASCHAAGTKCTRAHSPYAISGYFYGSTVAFKVAKCLEGIGEEVKSTGLINIPPHIANGMHAIDQTGSILNLSYFLGLVTKQDTDNLTPESFRHKEPLEVVWKLSPPIEVQLTPAKLDHWVDITGSLIEWGKDYNPGGSVCKWLSPRSLVKSLVWRVSS
ncbi:hypothetical protein HYDPIDRAFT_98277, partial [Hydnomerulius pinastri MD-312]